MCFIFMSNWASADVRKFEWGWWHGLNATKTSGRGFDSILRFLSVVWHTEVSLQILFGLLYIINLGLVILIYIRIDVVGTRASFPAQSVGLLSPVFEVLRMFLYDVRIILEELSGGPTVLCFVWSLKLASRWPRARFLFAMARYQFGPSSCFVYQKEFIRSLCSAYSTTALRRLWHISPFFFSRAVNGILVSLFSGAFLTPG